MSACVTTTNDGCVASRPTARRRIVLVDDEPKVLEIWGLILSQSGYDVRSCASPVSALDAIAEGCDCVITDYHMEEMTGVELIRAAHPRTQAKFILMTANGSDAVTEEALAVGACCIVHKPTSPPVLLQKIASLCA